jgi:hypothetical protein
MEEVWLRLKPPLTSIASPSYSDHCLIRDIGYDKLLMQLAVLYAVLPSAHMVKKYP